MKINKRMETRLQSHMDPFLRTDEFDLAHINRLNEICRKVGDHFKGRIYLSRVQTVLGTMIAGATEKGVCLFEYADSRKVEMEICQLITHLKMSLVESEHPHFKMLREQINAYFEGELQTFGIPLDLVGTDFQLQAWRGLANIPYGTTTSYAQQAMELGKSYAVRAVANANGKNRISIILPCHRVIGSDGKLTGYGGGLWRKKMLVDMEQQG